MDELDDAVRPHPDGAIVTVQAVPRAGRTEIAGIRHGAVRIRLAAPPVDGAANAALTRFLAARCDVGRSDVEVVRGTRGRDKVVLIRGRTVAQVRASLAGATGPAG